MYTRKHNTHKQDKDYKISLVTANGNTAAFLNLSSQFCKAVLKTPNPTLEDILTIADGNPIEFLKSLQIVIEPVLPDEPMEAKDF